MNIIQTLRQRPSEERQAFALMFAGGVALILFLVWGMTFFKGESVTTTSVKENVVSSKQDIKNIQSTFVKFATQISSQYVDLQKTISKSESSASSKNNATITGVNKKKDTMLGPFRRSTSTINDSQNTLINILDSERNIK